MGNAQKNNAQLYEYNNLTPNWSGLMLIDAHP